MNKALHLVNFQFKNILPFLVIPCFFLVSFYTYFYIISGSIYGYFNLNRIETLIYLPAIYKWSFVSCAIFCLLFGIIKEYKKLFAVIFFVFVVSLFIIYTLQYYSLFLTNRYLMPEAFLHIDQIFLIADDQLNIRTIIAFLFVSLFGYICWFIIKRFDQFSKTEGKHQAIVIQALLTIIIFIVLFIPSCFNLSLIHRTQFFGLPTTPPEIAFATSIKHFYLRSTDQKSFTLPNDLRNYISQYYGVSYQQHKEYPLVKDWIYQKTMPFKKVGNNSKKPNVIIFFMESLSTNLVGSYNSRMKTPNIDNFAQESMIIDGYYNHTFPTISGLRGQLCSFYPVLGENEHAEQEGIAIKLFCMPHVLNRNDYSTYFFYYHAPMYQHRAETPTVNIKKLMEACGFSTVYTARDIKKRLTGLDTPKGYSLINDLGMMTDLVNFLKGYKNTEKPFFIALSTIGTHPKIDDSGVKILESYRKLDQAFGVFLGIFQGKLLL